MKVLLIVPAYNEEENIVRVCNNLRENFSQYDFVVINDGSSDNTLKLCEDNHFPVISLPVNMLIELVMIVLFSLMQMDSICQNM